jgi:hypothetical protein
MMMNKEPKEESINIFKDIFIDFIVGYILLSWISAFLLSCYEFIVGPMFNALSPGNNSVCLNLNLSKNSVNTPLNQLVPIPIDQFIESELILIVPSTVLLGLIYYEAKKENNNE